MSEPTISIVPLDDGTFDVRRAGLLHWPAHVGRNARPGCGVDDSAKSAARPVSDANAGRMLLNGGRDGPEWSALMDRAREALNAYPHSAVGKEGVLRDILTYFGETP